MALIIRIKFPETYPIIYKNMRINGNLTVPAAIEYISNELSVPGGENFGFFLPDRQEWLPNDQPLMNFSYLQEVEEIEFKDRTAAQNGGGGGCCLVQ